jgi:hypothetical protein
MNYYTFVELAESAGCRVHREQPSNRIDVFYRGRKIATIYPGIGQVRLMTRFIPDEKAEFIVRLVAEFSLISEKYRYKHYMVRHCSGYWVKEFEEKGDDVKLVLTKNKQSAVEKLTATDRERLVKHKIGDMFEAVECND